MYKDTEKIGLAIITCDRIEFFKNALASVPHTVDHLVVVNDGSPYPVATYKNEGGIDEIIQHPRNMNVAVSKNDAIRALLKAGCKHIFLMEDDITIKSADVFDHYIACAAASGIWHLNYGGHGGNNRDPEGKLRVRNTVDYDGGKSIDFYEHVLGAFSYYYAGVIKHVGLMDERMHNAMEHVEHTYRIIKDNLHPPFWWFADAGNSSDYLDDQTENHAGSVIRKDPVVWETNFKRALSIFFSKHGKAPAMGAEFNIPQPSEQELTESLEFLHKNYVRNDLI